jgi:hypothetical protein
MPMPKGRMTDDEIRSHLLSPDFDARLDIMRQRSDCYMDSHEIAAILGLPLDVLADIVEYRIPDCVDDERPLAADLVAKLRAAAREKLQ